MLNRSSLLHYATCTIVLALLLRTWFVIGLIEPITIAGSSMAPTLRGSHYSFHCTECGQPFDFGVEFVTENSRVECLACGDVQIVGEHRAVKRGDRVLVDRTALQFREPKRWETFVFHSPDDAQLTVKRVVGLPGETVELRDGDVWIDGKIAMKSLPELRELRQLVHAETEQTRRWHGQGWHWQGWHWQDGAWQAAASDDWQWLIYDHNQPLTDDTAYNGDLSRRVFPVRDLALSVSIDPQGTGEVAVHFQRSGESLRWQGPISKTAQLEIFACDGRWQVFIDGSCVADEVCDPSLTDADEPVFQIGVQNMDVALRDLQIYRDIFYTSQNEELGIAEPMSPVVLAENEFFVLGDNHAVSLDSRQWGPVPRRLLVGKPLSAR
jgi:signal peptidase I